jgi:ABC-type microcin C transport system permease subunit YejE
MADDDLMTFQLEGPYFYKYEPLEITVSKKVNVLKYSKSNIMELTIFEQLQSNMREGDYVQIILLGIEIILFGIAMILTSSGIGATIGLIISFFGLMVSIVGYLDNRRK